MLSPIHDNLAFYLKEMEMEHQWELNQHSTESAQADAAAEPTEAAPAIRANRDLYLPHYVEQASESELTPEQHARLRDKAEALYGAVAEMEQDADGHELNRRA